MMIVIQSVQQGRVYHHFGIFFIFDVSSQDQYFIKSFAISNYADRYRLCANNNDGSGSESESTST